MDSDINDLWNQFEVMQTEIVKMMDMILKCDIADKQNLEQDIKKLYRENIGFGITLFALKSYTEKKS